MLKTFAKHFSCIVPILQSVSLCQHKLRCCQNFFFPSQHRRKERLAENRTSVARNRKTFKIKRFFFRRKPPFHALIAPLLTSALSFNLRSVLSPSFQLFFLHLLLLPPLSPLALFLPPSSPPPPVDAVISLQLCSPAQTQQPCSWERRCRRCCCCCSC